MLPIIVFHFFCLLPTQNILHKQHDYTEQASVWARHVLDELESHPQHLTTHDSISQLLKLLYLSYNRSQNTLAIQSPALNALGQTWQAWHNVMYTRLNPSKILPKPYSVKTGKKAFDTFNTAYARYEQAATHYAHYVNSLVTQSEVNAPILYKLVQEIRATARTETSKALLGSMVKIRALIKEAQDRIKVSADRFDAATLLKQASLEQAIPEDRDTKAGALEFLWDQIQTPLLVHSFVTFDNEYTQLTRGCFEAFMYSQEMNVLLWEIIEHTRASFYAAYYTALYTEMKNAGYAVDNFTQPSLLEKK